MSVQKFLAGFAVGAAIGAVAGPCVLTVFVLINGFPIGDPPLFVLFIILLACVFALSKKLMVYSSLNKLSIISKVSEVTSSMLLFELISITLAFVKLKAVV